MTAPIRWRDDPTAPDGVRKALRVGRPSRRLPSEARQRSAARLDRLVSVPAAAGLLFWIKGAAIAGLCVAGTVTAVHRVASIAHVKVAPEAPLLDAHASRKRPAVSRPTSESSTDAPAPVEALSPVTTPEIPAPTPTRERPLGDVPVAREKVAIASRNPAPRAAPSARDSIENDHPAVDARPRDSLAQEAAMLEEARAMLDKNPSHALAALDRYAATFPDGRLSIERDLLVVDALRRSGRAAEARAHAAALLERARGSLYEPRIRAMMGE